MRQHRPAAGWTTPRCEVWHGWLEYDDGKTGNGHARRTSAAVLRRVPGALRHSVGAFPGVGLEFRRRYDGGMSKLPTTIGKHRIERELGRGASGTHVFARLA